MDDELENTRERPPEGPPKRPPPGGPGGPGAPGGPSGTLTHYYCTGSWLSFSRAWWCTSKTSTGCWPTEISRVLWTKKERTWIKTVDCLHRPLFHRPIQQDAQLVDSRLHQRSQVVAGSVQYCRQVLDHVHYYYYNDYYIILCTARCAALLDNESANNALPL
jgi:hypothetical protein